MKHVQRQQALAARAQGGDDAALTANLLRVLGPDAGCVLAGYWPIRGEADPRPAMRHHLGTICLPVVVQAAHPLIFRAYDGRLEPGRFGTSHPPQDCAEVVPQVLIVPLAGFDRAGNRLGYGGGFYDRTLAALRRAGPVTAIGFAYAVQEIRAIPVEPTDQPMDVIVTDREILRPAN